MMLTFFNFVCYADLIILGLMECFGKQKYFAKFNLP